MENKTRIIGFDLARAYAIFGMFIVNFNIVFGEYHGPGALNAFLNLFNGNSSTLFVMLAGMGVALLTNRPSYTEVEKRNLRSIIMKRSWFLFVMGLLLYLWWPADILHFYGGYMHVAALLLFVPKRWYVLGAVAAICIWHVLLLVIPFEIGWNFDTLRYTDFWTVEGFLRNTFYNGWNPIFPWLAFFLFGMWLARLNWQEARLKKRVLMIALAVYAFVEALRWWAVQPGVAVDVAMYLTADYLPPTLPFVLSTASFGCILLVIWFWIGERWGQSRIAGWLAATGQMTLTHYILSLTVGMLLFAALSGIPYINYVVERTTASPMWVLVFSIVYFSSSVLLSVVWKSRFKNGPFEMLMRKISG
jgi:uncharacterized membrane protein YeiB